MPRSPAEARRWPEPDPLTDAVILGVVAVVLVLSFVLEPSTEAVSLFGWKVPTLCVFRALTGTRCLGCGLTRSFVFLAHGDLRHAFSQHVLGPLLYLVFVAQVPLRSMRLWRAWRRRRAAGSAAGRG